MLAGGGVGFWDLWEGGGRTEGGETKKKMFISVDAGGGHCQPIAMSNIRIAATQRKINRTNNPLLLEWFIKKTEWTRQEDEKLLHLAKLVPEPFLGGDNPEMHPSEFYGVTTRKKEIQTMPTPSATPEVPPKNEYQIVVQPVPEDDDEPEEKTEEDMFDRLAREGAEEEARQQALLRKR
ncbi:hypothetical protein ACFX13_010788 [Malus domestica]